MRIREFVPERGYLTSVVLAAALVMGSEAGAQTTLNGPYNNGSAPFTTSTPVILGSDVSITAGSVGFSGTVDGNHSLFVLSSGTTEFDGAVGNASALTTLTIGGTSALLGGSVTTTGVQTYEGAATLGFNTTLTASHANFSSALDGAYALSVAGDATFNGAVGSGIQLTSLDVSGMSSINGGAVKTTGAQTYVGAATLGSSTTLTASNVHLSSTLDGAHALTVSGGAEFDGAVGGVSALSSLTVSATSALLGGSVKTSGAQTYQGAATLGVDTILTASKVTFGSTLDGAYALTVTGNAAFTGAVGSGTQLTSLDVSGTSAINGGAITTSGKQSYSGAVSFGNNATLTASSLLFGSAFAVDRNQVTLATNSLGLSSTTLTFDITSDGKGGFQWGSLTIDPSATLNFKSSDIAFDFLGGADAYAFQADGLFNLDNFFKTSDGSEFSSDQTLSGLFDSDMFTIADSDLAINGVDFASGDVTGIHNVPEPLSSVLLLTGVGALVMVMRCRSTRAA